MLGVSSCWFGPVLLFVAARIGAFSLWKRGSRVSSLHISVSSLKRAPVRIAGEVSSGVRFCRFSNGKSHHKVNSARTSKDLSLVLPDQFL